MELPSLEVATENVPSSARTTPRAETPLTRSSIGIEPSAATLLARTLTAAAIATIPRVPLVILVVVLPRNAAAALSSARTTPKARTLETRFSGSTEEMVLSAADNINTPVEIATIAPDSAATWNFLPRVSVFKTLSAATSSVNSTVMLMSEPVSLSGLTIERTVSDAAKTAIALATVMSVSAFLLVFQAVIASPRDLIAFLTPSTTPETPLKISLPLLMKFLIALRIPRPIPAFMKL